MKYPKLTIFLVIILACICTCFETFGRGWAVDQIVNVWTSQMYDYAQFGWYNDTPESVKAEMPKLERVETFRFQEDFNKYLLDTYGADKEIWFTCVHPLGEGDNLELMPVSRIVQHDCAWGYAVVYKWQMPK